MGKGLPLSHDSSHISSDLSPIDAAGFFADFYSDRKRLKPILLMIGLAIVTLVYPGSGWAHPLGNFSLNHYTLLDIYPGGILAQHVLDFAEIPSYNELANVDIDGDNRVTPDEMNRYKAAIADRFLPNFVYAEIGADGTIHPLLPQKIVQNDVILSRGQGNLTCLQVQLACLLPLDPSRWVGEHRLVFEDKNLTHLRGAREIRVKSEIERLVHPEDVSVSGGAAAPVVSASNCIQIAGLNVTVKFTAKEMKEVEVPRLADLRSFINPASIPIYPLEPEADGGFLVVKSPLRPNQEVQAKIALLQPRNVMNATASLFSSSQPTPGALVGQSDQTVGADSAYARSTTDSQWGNLVGAQDLSPKMVVLAIILSVFFGASHALSPGHGKTVVAAYLVGSRGTILHAVFLGIVVTITHVSSVLLLGLITLYFSQYIVPDKLYPLIESASGLIIVGIGLTLFFKRYAAYQRMRFAESLGIAWEEKPHVQPHEHPHTDHEPEHSHEHPHDHDHPHTHPHPYDHDHPHEEAHEHPHTHMDHSRGLWDHEHGPSAHTHEIPTNAAFKELLLLGITGGIVPCPTAIVVLIAAIALHRIWFGLALIVFFSFGLASVLIAIGVLMVSTKRFLGRFQHREQSLRWLQILSPVLVTLLGLVIFLRGLQTGGFLSIHL